MSEIKFPAFLITNKSPIPWSNSISGATRLSEQVTMTAKGCCPF